MSLLAKNLSKADAKCLTQILGEKHTASTGRTSSTRASHCGRWYIVSSECANKNTIITSPHHLLQISSYDSQRWTESKRVGESLFPAVEWIIWKQMFLSFSKSELRLGCLLHWDALYERNVQTWDQPGFTSVDLFGFVVKSIWEDDDALLCAVSMKLVGWH